MGGNIDLKIYKHFLVYVYFFVIRYSKDSIVTVVYFFKHIYIFRLDTTFFSDRFRVRPCPLLPPPITTTSIFLIDFA